MVFTNCMYLCVCTLPGRHFSNLSWTLFKGYRWYWWWNFIKINCSLLAEGDGELWYNADSVLFSVLFTKFFLCVIIRIELNLAHNFFRGLKISGYELYVKSVKNKWPIVWPHYWIRIHPRLQWTYELGWFQIQHKRRIGLWKPFLSAWLRLAVNRIERFWIWIS